MRLTPRNRTAYRLRLPEGTGTDAVMELLARYDPETTRRRKRATVPGGTLVVQDGEIRIPAGQEGLARALGHHLRGSWLLAPPEAGEQDEPLHDLVRVYVGRKLLPAELATALRPVLPGVAIREDPRLGLFWFDDEDSELTISAWPVEALPPAAGSLREAEALYEVGVDDVDGPTERSAEEAWRVARLLEQELGGIAVDRYGFRITQARDLL